MEKLSRYILDIIKKQFINNRIETLQTNVYYAKDELSYWFDLRGGIFSDYQRLVQNSINGLIFKIDNKYHIVQITSMDKYLNGIGFKLVFQPIDYQSYLDMIPEELRGEILSHIIDQTDVNNYLEALMNPINETVIYKFLISKTFPEIYRFLIEIERIDNKKYNTEYKKIYLYLNDGTFDKHIKDEPILYRLYLYKKYPNLYPKLNQYMTDDLLRTMIKYETLSDESVRNKLYENYIKTGTLPNKGNIIPSNLTMGFFTNSLPSNIIFWLFMNDNGNIINKIVAKDTLNKLMRSEHNIIDEYIKKKYK